MKAPRTLVFVPATRLDRVEKALATSADVVIIDLEDSVRADEKVSSRQNLKRLEPSRPVYVRVNASASVQFLEDVALVSSVPWVSAVVLPKVHSQDDVEHFREVVSRDVDLVALIESSSGVVACDEIARSGVSRLMFGSVDYAAELNAPPGQSLFAYPRSRLVVASAAAGLPAPVDGPTLAIDDIETLREESLAALALGMGGKLCIHPKQISIVESIFATAQSAKSWAQEVLSAYESAKGGVFVVKREMIDAPVVARARKILET